MLFCLQDMLTDFPRLQRWVGLCGDACWVVWGCLLGRVGMHALDDCTQCVTGACPVAGAYFLTRRVRACRLLQASHSMTPLVMRVSIATHQELT